MPDFNLIRHELNKLTELPPWRRSQGDAWDQLSDFVYRVKTLRGIRRQARARARAEGLDPQAFEAYAVRRWFNHHTHDQVLKIFLDHPDVRPEPNRRHHSVDFYLRGTPFDLKISPLPRAYPSSLEQAQQDPHHLAAWLYENQSRQGRYHTGNRCFIILHNRTEPDLSWRQRCDFAGLEARIGDFLAAPTLLGLTLTDHHSGETVQPWAAVIFYVRD